MHKKHTMRACLFLWILLKQTFDFSASQEFYFLQRLEGESVDMFCVAPANKSQPWHLYLRRRFARSESVRGISEDQDAAPESEGHVWISGQMNSSAVTVTLSHLRVTDTGLYSCGFSGDPSGQLSPSTTFFLLVTEADEGCYCWRFALLIYSSSVGVALLLLALAAVYKKSTSHEKPQTVFSIYEDMSSVRGRGSSEDHLRIHPSNPQTSAPGRTNSNTLDI